MKGMSKHKLLDQGQVPKVKEVVTKSLPPALGGNPYHISLLMTTMSLGVREVDFKSG